MYDRKGILLILVCCKGYLFIVKILIKEGVDVNGSDGCRILLILVCFYGYLDVV